MREFSKVSPTVWRSQKFRKLADMEARHVYLYLLTCPHGNSAGCFDLHPMYAAADLGMSEDAYRKAFTSLCDSGLVAFDESENTLWIVNWDEFNEPTNPKHAMGLLSQLQNASSDSLKSRAFHAFLPRLRRRGFDKDAALKKALAVFLEAYPEPIATRPDQTRDQTETEKETRPDQTRPETREKVSRSPLRALAADGGALAAPEGKAQPPPSPSRLLETRFLSTG